MISPAKATVRPPSLLARPYRMTTFGIILVVALLAFEAMAVGTAMPVTARDLHGLGLYATPSARRSPSESPARSSTRRALTRESSARPPSPSSRPSPPTE